MKAFAVVYLHLYSVYLHTVHAFTFQVAIQTLPERIKLYILSCLKEFSILTKKR